VSSNGLGALEFPDVNALFRGVLAILYTSRMEQLTSTILLSHA
jgi:hypothetical protein